MSFLVRQLLVISLFVHLGMANALADPNLSEKANMARGVLLYEEEKYQEAYDLFFKDIQNYPEYLEWIAAYVKKHNITVSNDESETADDIAIQFKSDGKKWALIGLDVGLGLISVVSVLNYNKSVDEYEEMLEAIDATTESNYWILRSKEDAVTSKKRAATIFSIGAGVSIAYTLADAFFLHKFFPEKSSLTLKSNEIVFAMKVPF